MQPDPDPPEAPGSAGWTVRPATLTRARSRGYAWGPNPGGPMAGPMAEAERTFDLARFDLAEMLRCGAEIRERIRMAETVEGAGRGIVRYLHEALRDGATAPAACALVRMFVTQPYGALDPELQEVARGATDAVLAPNTTCLALLASAGEEEAWRDRRRSQAHRAIPLTSAEMVRSAPMIARLIESFGVPIEALAGTPDRRRLPEATGGRTYGVLHVADAVGSPYIPAQDTFVKPYGIRSVVGFGGALATGEVVAVILFARITVPARAAERFRSIALDLKAGLHRFGAGEVFERA